LSFSIYFTSSESVLASSGLVDRPVDTAVKTVSCGRKQQGDRTMQDSGKEKGMRRMGGI